MGYQVYYSGTNRRWQGYGVPAECDYVGCYEDIDRGLGFKCEEPDCECELFYCYEHLGFIHDEYSVDPKPDTIEWLEHILTDESWAEFREENPSKVRIYKEIVGD
jgi:hypothetical protein